MSDILRELQPLLDEWAAEAGVPGAAVGILLDGEDTVLATGVSSVDAPLPVDGDSLFMVGSTTKTFTAAAIMALVEDGVLDLDVPVVEYLPDLPLADAGARASVTLRHLLTHTGGFLGDVEVDTGWGSDALAEAVAGFGALPQVFPTGEVFSYSNSGFMLAGHVAEVVSGSLYEDLVRERLLEPLGMTDSVFLPWEVLTRRHTVGHATRDGSPVVAHVLGLPRAAAAAGGLWSSARDQLRWARFFLLGEADGTPPLSEDSRVALWQPQRPAALPFEEVGLSWLRTRHGAAQLVRHGGNVSNLQVSEFVTLPSERFAVTVLTNSAGGSGLRPRVVDWCLENLAGVAPIPDLPVLPPERLAEYAGCYETGQLAFEFDVRDGGLWVRMAVEGDPGDAPPPFEVAFVGEDVVARATDTRKPAARFVRDGDGRVALVEFGGRTARLASAG
ncbi:serine hydrolase domain-containing protein [Actinosynnema sp. NPDC047251]|uniref:Beta-lactamase n=1 Tax=Saccharothrix espanaensis (strain ATCC 51144 / DSM 44229 / JCM 9112 / NBRC 15066 / NRRL 15764) TaxID=1179773 RepID=K0JY12_SACES|nr:serine hydrolase domain-containing protein [Saccharothrix espanaensis]CCH29579.1 beta-lactamase [Saccharothrix espanaensis DSM 44229]